jgi:hypothetical protein
LRAEAQLVDVVNDLAEIIAAGDFVSYLTKDLPDFVFNGIRSAGLLYETVQVGKELPVDEIAQSLIPLRPGATKCCSRGRRFVLEQITNLTALGELSNSSWKMPTASPLLIPSCREMSPPRYRDLPLTARMDVGA